MYFYNSVNGTLHKDDVWYPKLRCYIIDKYKLIFIRILKNASSSIVRSLNLEFGDTHYFYSKEIREKIRWDKYKVFTILRDPVERLISAFAFHERANCYVDNKDYLDYREYDEDKRFDRFVENIKQWGYLNSHHYPQEFFISDIVGTIVDIDYYLKVDDYLIYNIKKIIPDLTLIHAKKGNYEIKFNKKAIKLINELYKEDYKLLKRINL